MTAYCEPQSVRRVFFVVAIKGLEMHRLCGSITTTVFAEMMMVMMMTIITRIRAF